MELWLESAFILRGVSWGYYQGNTLKLLEDVAVLKPTLFVAVPRLLNRIYDKVSAAASQVTGAKKVLSSIAREAKEKAMAQGRVCSLWDFIVFNKVSALLGGRVRFIATGSAPIAPNTLAFYRLFFSAVVIEGYVRTRVVLRTSEPEKKKKGEQEEEKKKEEEEEQEEEEGGERGTRKRRRRRRRRRSSQGSQPRNYC
jgi:long-subunit acyl-CoA synthetase (AMP-forming)